VRAIAVSILLASSALAGDAPALVVAGPKGETKSLHASDLQELAVREVTSPSLTASRPCGIAACR
jgi:hypothetical protein